LSVDPACPEEGSIREVGFGLPVGCKDQPVAVAALGDQMGALELTLLAERHSGGVMVHLELQPLREHLGSVRLLA
jgi:hypothetical protein